MGIRTTLVAATLGAALVAPTGCGSKGALESGIGRTAPLRVERITPRGPYLDVVLAGDGVELRSFTPDDDACRRLLGAESGVQYASVGAGGRFTRGEQVCDAVGIGDPFLQRLRQPRGTSSGGPAIPRAQATYRALHLDDEVALLHGSFPLARFVGWAGGRDTVAVVARGGACEGPIARGVASMEYRPTGPDTLGLVGSDGLCRIEGLILPLR